jgi:hydrogenase maturation protease
VDLRHELRRALDGRTCLVGVGSADLGDDGFGPALARTISGSGFHVIDAGTSPEDRIAEIVEGRFRNVIFLDAVDVGGTPGSAALLDAAAVQTRFPQVSTHRISLGALARLIEAGSGARVWLLGVQPLALRPGGLSQPVRETLEMLTQMIADALPGGSTRPLAASAAGRSA